MSSRASPAGFPLSAKLIVGCLLVTVPSLAVLAAISLYALWDLTGVNRQLQEISRSLEAVQALETAVARSVTPLTAYIVDRARGEQQRFKASIDEVESRLEGCSGAACHGISKQPKAMAKSLAPHVRAIKERASIVFRTGESQTEQDKVRALHEINQQSEDAVRQLGRMTSTLLLRVASLEEQSQETSQRAVALILASIAAVLMVAAVAAYLLSRRLLGHIGDLVTGTRHIMQGDLGYRVAPTGEDEIGQLARSFNAMAQEIQEHRAHLEQMVQAKAAELRRTQDSLIRSEKLASIGLLASGVAHELNNPLTSILMNVNLLIEDALDRPALRMELQRIGEDTVRCKRIIDELKDFSRRQEMEIAPADLNRLVREALALIGRRWDLRAITVVPELSPGLPLVPCDAARMERVLANILVNAIQAMPHGGTLTVGTVLRAGHAEISVQDTGPGIAPEIQSKIFDPFFTTKPQGTGLGLAIVYQIMEAHGGSIEVRSATRASFPAGSLHPFGTRFLVSLPLGPKAAQTEGTARSG